MLVLDLVEWLTGHSGWKIRRWSCVIPARIVGTHAALVNPACRATQAGQRPPGNLTRDLSSKRRGMTSGPGARSDGTAEQPERFPDQARAIRLSRATWRCRALSRLCVRGVDPHFVAFLQLGQLDTHGVARRGGEGLALDHEGIAVEVDVRDRPRDSSADAASAQMARAVAPPTVRSLRMMSSPQLVSTRPTFQ